MLSTKLIKKSFKLILTTAAASLFLVAGTSNSASAASADNDKQYSEVLKTAKKQLGKRYSWGAVGPNRFDCSGFTKYVYKKSIKKAIPRTAQAQYNGTKKVSKSNLKKGDLVYFGGSTRSISHVGLYVGNGRMIDSQNRGVITESIYSPWWHFVGASRPTTLSYDK